MKADTKAVKATVKSKKGEVSAYQANVLNVNKALKTQRKTFGGCIKTLLMYGKEIGLSPRQIKVLRFVQKDKLAFDTFKSNTRTAHYKGEDLGTYSPFYVLQALNKQLAQYDKEARESAKKAKTKK